MGVVFGTGAPWAADAVLLAEVGIGIGLLAGMLLVRAGHVRLHRALQSTLVLANPVLLLAWMLPSYLVHAAPGVPAEVAEPYYLLPTLMLVLGPVAQGLAIYVVLSAGTSLLPERFRFRRYKLMMRATLVLWWAVLALGVLTYLAWYVLGYSS